MSFHGILNELCLEEVLQLFGLFQRSGRLTLVCPRGNGEILLNRGRVVYCRLENGRRLGSALVGRGLVTPEDLDEVLHERGQAPDGPALGRLLLRRGNVDRRELEHAIRDHVVDSLREVSSWTGGFFYFHGCTVTESHFVAAAGFPVELLLLESSRRDDEARESAVKQRAPAPRLCPSAAAV